MNFVFEGDQLQPGEKYIEENGFIYRDKEELIKAISLNPEYFAEMLIIREVAEQKEV